VSLERKRAGGGMRHLPHAAGGRAHGLFVRELPPERAEFAAGRGMRDLSPSAFRVASQHHALSRALHHLPYSPRVESGETRALPQLPSGPHGTQRRGRLPRLPSVPHRRQGALTAAGRLAASPTMRANRSASLRIEKKPEPSHAADRPSFFNRSALSPQTLGPSGPFQSAHNRETPAH